MSLKSAMIKDAREILDSTLKNGDPFNGGDWSLVQILREYILIKESEDNNSGYFIIKVHKDTIQGYGLTSDLTGETTYGICNSVIKNYCDIHEMFIPNGTFYSPPKDLNPPLKIPKGDTIILGKLI